MLNKIESEYNSEGVKNINTILSEFNDYNEIQNKPELDALIPEYLEAVRKDINKPEQIDFVLKSIKKNDIQSKAAIFHEKKEIQWLLDNGYSTEDIRSGKAHHEKYNEAHNHATEAQYKLYQFISEKEYGYKIPMTIFTITEPYGEDGSLLWFMVLSDHPDDLHLEDVEKSMSIFEKFGSGYKDRDKIKEKCETFIKNCKEKDYKKILEKINPETKTEAGEYFFCKKCNSPLGVKDNFCTYCGIKIERKK